MISMEDTGDDILSGELNVKYSVTKIENSFTALSPQAAASLSGQPNRNGRLTGNFFPWQESFCAVFCFTAKN